MNDKREILTRLVTSVLPTEYVPGEHLAHIEIVRDCNEIAEEIMKHREDIPDSPCPHVMTCGCEGVCNTALRGHMDADAIQAGKEYDPVSQRFIDVK